MFQCHVCGSMKGKEKIVDEVFIIDDKPILVQHIPAVICSHCGGMIFARETTEKVRRMVHGEAKPIKSISLDVFAYA